MKNNHRHSSTSTTGQGHLIGLDLDMPVTCPDCGHTFPVRAGLGDPTIAQVEARQAEFVSAWEQEWQVRLEAEATAAAEKAALERDRRHAAEKRRIEQQLGVALAENADLLKQQEELAKEQQALAKARRALAADRSKLELELSRQLDEVKGAASVERERLKKLHSEQLLELKKASLEEGRRQAIAEQSEQLTQISATLAATRKQAEQRTKLLQQAELAKLEMEERLQKQTHAMQVELKKESNKLRKQLEAEYERTNQALLAEALESERSRYALKRKEDELEKDQLRKKVEQLHRQLEQKSQQVRGEALEIVLEQRLAELCPKDAVEAIKSGAKGADVLHSVYNEKGSHVANITWEYKNTNIWRQSWLAKLERDARKNESSAAVLVTTTLPKGMKGRVAFMDGCWICSVDAWEGLALLLRAHVVKVAQLEKGLERRDNKAMSVYKYLQSDQFRSVATTMLNTLSAMEGQVTAEEQAFGKQWKLRREQIQRMIDLHLENIQTIEAITAEDIVEDTFLG